MACGSAAECSRRSPGLPRTRPAEPVRIAFELPPTHPRPADGPDWASRSSTMCASFPRQSPDLRCRVGKGARRLHRSAATEAGELRAWGHGPRQPSQMIGAAKARR